MLVKSYFKVLGIPVSVDEIQNFMCELGTGERDRERQTENRVERVRVWPSPLYSFPLQGQLY